MQRQLTDSSNIRSIGYDPATLTLEIEFASGGVYQFPGVNFETYNDFMAAPSKGRFFAGHIRGKFESRKVNPAPQGSAAA